MIRKAEQFRRTGMTLIECAISIAVVSTMLVAAMYALGAFSRARRSQFERCTGGALARALMSEILQCRYAESLEDVTFGRDSGESSNLRSDWDDVDDYHGLIESPPESRSGQTVVGADGWTRKVIIERVQADNPGQVASKDTGLVRVTVQAVSPTGVTTTLRALRGSQSLYDRAPSEETTFLTWVAFEMQIGPDESKRLTTGTHILNPIAVSD